MDESSLCESLRECFGLGIQVTRTEERHLKAKLLNRAGPGLGLVAGDVLFPEQRCKHNTAELGKGLTGPLFFITTLNQER